MAGQDRAQRPEHIFLAQQGAVNLLVAIVMALVTTVLVFHGRAAVPLWGMGNLAFDLMPATLLPSIGGTMAITKATAMAVSRGRIAPATGLAGRMLPHNDFLAGVVIGLGCLVVLGGLVHRRDADPLCRAAGALCRCVHRQADLCAHAGLRQYADYRRPRHAITRRRGRNASRLSGRADTAPPPAAPGWR